MEAVKAAPAFRKSRFLAHYACRPDFSMFCGQVDLRVFIAWFKVAAAGSGSVVVDGVFWWIDGRKRAVLPLLVLGFFPQTIAAPSNIL